jgi:hypothetical protein
VEARVEATSNVSVHRRARRDVGSETASAVVETEIEHDDSELARGQVGCVGALVCDRRVGAARITVAVDVAGDARPGVDACITHEGTTTTTP